MTRSHFHVYLYGPAGGALTSRFEDVSDRLSQVDRLHMELDGAFVWVGQDWQVDGMIYDHDDRIRYVDLKGTCPLVNWQSLVRWIADPAESGMPEHPTVWMLSEQSLHDLQTFEEIIWPAT